MSTAVEDAAIQSTRLVTGAESASAKTTVCNASAPAGTQVVKFETDPIKRESPLTGETNDALADW